MVGFSVLAIAAKVASRSAPRLRRAPITLTEEAASRIKDLLTKRNKVECFHLRTMYLAYSVCQCNEACGAIVSVVVSTLFTPLQDYLRLGVKRRGCNGLAYTLNYAG